MNNIHPDTALLTLLGDLQTERLQLREALAQRDRVIEGLRAQLAALPAAGSHGITVNLPQPPEGLFLQIVVGERMMRLTQEGRLELAGLTPSEAALVYVSWNEGVRQALDIAKPVLKPGDLAYAWLDGKGGRISIGIEGAWRSNLDLDATTRCFLDELAALSTDLHADQRPTV